MELVDFAWTRPGPNLRWIDGFEVFLEDPEDDPSEPENWFPADWAAADRNLTRLLTHKSIVGPLGRNSALPGDFYEPLKSHPTLFRQFADLPNPPDESAVQSFASEFGWLGANVVFGLGWSGDEHPQLITAGELLDSWTIEVSELRTVLDLWELVCKEDQGALGERFRVLPISSTKGQLTIEYVSPEGYSVPQFSYDGAFEAESSATWAASHAATGAAIRYDFIPAATELMTHVLQGKLSVLVRAAVINEARKLPQVAVRPVNLLGAIWFQTAQAIGGGYQYRRCENCPRWFFLSPDFARTNRKTCSPACRTAAHRQRIKDAVLRWRAGEQLEAIAASLGSEIGTVQSWIERASKGTD